MERSSEPALGLAQRRRRSQDRVLHAGRGGSAERRERWKSRRRGRHRGGRRLRRLGARRHARIDRGFPTNEPMLFDNLGRHVTIRFFRGRSEERRVGKSVDLGGRRIIKKKKK